jgi:methyl acetate hydrolase
MKAAADKVLQDAVSRGDVPGVVATATDAKGTTYEGGFGKRMLGEAAEMTPDTVVWIASMTKAVTGAAAMQLVERGKLSLDAPARAVIPALGEARVLEGFDAAGKPRTRQPKRDITLRHLLTHTAGFGYDIWSPEIAKYMEAMEVPGIISCQNKALTTPLLFDPGDRWFYGINIDFAGKMVEAASGQTLGRYMQDNLFGPLGMTSTAFRISDDMRRRLAKIHHRGADGALVADPTIEIPQEPEFEMGGGGLYSTAGDYLKFVRLMLNHGRSDKGEAVLKPETVAEMSKNAMGDCRVCLLKTAAPPFSNDAEFFPGMEKTWGLSFMINNADAPTGRSAGSLAWAGLANTYYWIDQKKGLGGVYTTQILPFADVKSLPLFHAFESTVYGR